MCGLTSWVGVEDLNAVAGCQSFLQQRGELLRELLPVLLPNLLLKTMQDLREGTTDGRGRASFRLVIFRQTEVTPPRFRSFYYRDMDQWILQRINILAFVP